MNYVMVFLRVMAGKGKQTVEIRGLPGLKSRPGAPSLIWLADMRTWATRRNDNHPVAKRQSPCSAGLPAGCSVGLPTHAPSFPGSANPLGLLGLQQVLWKIQLRRARTGTSAQQPAGRAALHSDCPPGTFVILLPRRSPSAWFRRRRIEVHRLPHLKIEMWATRIHGRSDVGHPPNPRQCSVRGLAA